MGKLKRPHLFGRALFAASAGRLILTTISVRDSVRVVAATAFQISGLRDHVWYRVLLKLPAGRSESRP